MFAVCVNFVTMKNMGTNNCVNTSADPFATVVETLRDSLFEMVVLLRVEAELSPSQETAAALNLADEYLMEVQEILVRMTDESDRAAHQPSVPRHATIQMRRAV